MSEPALIFSFDPHAGFYRPEDCMSGQLEVDGVAGDEIRAIEVSVLWCTFGKGDEDLGVHYFRRFAGEGRESQDMTSPCRFETRLPRSPLSYDGFLIKITWSVRGRAFLHGGQELFAEQPFQLGAMLRPELPRQQVSPP